MSRIVVAGVGNVLRGDDGFGAAVVSRLEDMPDGVKVVETGIGGVALLQELLAGCDGLVLVDAVDEGRPPGTVVVIEPEVADGEHVADVHLVDPRRVLSMAKSMGALPARVRVVGCQAGGVDELGGPLSAPVKDAVEPAAAKVREIVHAWV